MPHTPLLFIAVDTSACMQPVKKDQIYIKNTVVYVGRNIIPQLEMKQQESIMHTS